MAALMRRALCAIALVAAAALAASAAVTVTDDAGTTITLAAPARRIVSLAPHATELLYAAGAGDRVVGVLTTSNWPPEAKALPRVGDSRALDLERIFALAPDLVVSWPFAAPAQVDALRAHGIPVFFASPETIDGIASDLERLGTLAGTTTVASERARAFRERHRAIAARNKGARAVRVFYEVWNVPLYTLGGRHLVSEAIALCGGTNVFASLTLPAPTVTVEAVLAAQPEAIIAGADGAARPAWLGEWKRWSALPAIAYDNLYTVDADLLHRAGPRFLDGAETLCAALAQARNKLETAKARAPAR
jgi:iron complex transport system substrate-binding protein